MLLCGIIHGFRWEAQPLIRPALDQPVKTQYTFYKWGFCLHRPCRVEHVCHVQLVYFNLFMLRSFTNYLPLLFSSLLVITACYLQLVVLGTLLLSVVCFILRVNFNECCGWWNLCSAMRYCGNCRQLWLPSPTVPCYWGSITYPLSNN